MQKIKGTQDYSCNGYILGKYESSKGGTRWMVIDSKGNDVAGDYTHLWKARDYAEQHPHG